MARNTRRGKSSANRKSTSSNSDSTKRTNPKDSNGVVRTKSSAAVANIVNASASIAVRNIAGNPVHIPHTEEPYVDNVYIPEAKSVVPGVVGIRYIPTFGVATGKQTEPVNLAARNMWMNLRSLYSNRIPYTAGAIVMYSMALDSILMAFQVLKRAYGVCFAYDARNRYVADGIIHGMGIDPVDFRLNLPDIKVYINRLATQLSAFGVPTELKFIYDHVDWASHVYMDDVAANAQYIVTTPKFYWKIDWANNKLVPHEIESYATHWFYIKQQMDQLVESFVNYEDCYMIASDMLRLYGSLATVGPVNSDYMVGPEFSPEFLEKMHNASYTGSFRGAGDATSDAAWTVTEDQAPENVGAVHCSWCDEVEVVDQQIHLFATTPGLFDYKGDDPTMEQIIESANLKYVLQPIANTSDSFKVKFRTLGTIVIDHIYFVTMGNVGGTYGYVKDDFDMQLSDGVYHRPQFVAGDISDYVLWDRATLLPFSGSWRVIRDTSVNPPRVTIDLGRPFGQLDQYVTIDVEDLSRIHEAIILDAFDAAGVGTLNLHAK